MRSNELHGRVARNRVRSNPGLTVKRHMRFHSN